MSTRMDNLTSTVLMAAAVAVAASAVYRTVAQPAGANATSEPDFISGWEEAISFGILAGGRPDAPVTLIELSDLECPACASFHEVLDSVIAARPDDLRYIFVHHPLAYHRHAFPAARAAECAWQAGRFASFIRVVFDKQDSLGAKSWGSFAAEAGIQDTSFIADCATSDKPVRRIDAGLAYGARINLAGTPSIILNGWRLRRTPSRRGLDSAITAILARDRPF